MINEVIFISNSSHYNAWAHIYFPLSSLRVQDSNMMEEPYVDQTESAAPSNMPAVGAEGSKLPPVLANLMGSLGNSGRSPQMQGNPAPPANNPALNVNVQELLTSIMVRDTIGNNTMTIPV